MRTREQQKALISNLVETAGGPESVAESLDVKVATIKGYCSTGRMPLSTTVKIIGLRNQLQRQAERIQRRQQLDNAKSDASTVGPVTPN